MSIKNFWLLMKAAFNYGKDMARSRGQDERPGTKSKDRQE